MFNIIFQKIGAGIVGVSMLIGGWFGYVPEKNFGGSTQASDVIALFTTSLASKITSTQTTLTLTSALDKDGTALASSTYGFIIDEGTATEELILADCTSTACTNLTRGLSVRTGTTTVSALRYEHRRGAEIKITDAPSLIFATNVFRGKQNIENAMTYNTAVSFATTSLALPFASWVAGFANVASTSAYNSILDTSLTFNNSKTFSATTTFTQGLDANGRKVLNVQTPTVSTDGANKSYVDGVAVAGASNADDTTKGIVEMATGAEAAAGTSLGATGARLALGANIATSTSQVAQNSVVVSNTSGKIDSSFLDNITPTGTTTASKFVTATSTAQFENGIKLIEIGKNVQVFSSTGTTTFSTPSGVSKIYVELVSGGGGGGGCSSGANGNCGGGGGGGGGYANKIIDITGTSTIQVFVGSGGAGGTAPNTGSSGTWSTFGTNGYYFYATKGVGGDGASTAGANGGEGGVGTNGDININGNGGGAGIGLPAIGGSGYPLNAGGVGGASFFGGGALGRITGAGVGGTNYGGGASGGAQFNSQSANGGAGAQGIVIVRW